MPYSFLLTDQSVQSALRRIAGEELSAMLANFSGPAPLSPKSVHDTRKHIKKIRSLIRLVRDGFHTYAAENKVLRDAGRQLSGPRDRTVVLATFDTLMGRADAHEEVTALRVEISESTEAQANASYDDLEPILYALHDRVQDWQIKGDDVMLLLNGLSTTRSNARKAMRLAHRHPDPEVFHEWRKRTKDLWYQSRLLSPIWPEVMKPLNQAADTLGESLGQHHDLSVLQARVKALPSNLRLDVARADLFDRVLQAQTAIAATAFPLGARLFAGDPDAITRQWLSWWKTWRAQAIS